MLAHADHDFVQWVKHVTVTEGALSVFQGGTTSHFSYQYSSSVKPYLSIEYFRHLTEKHITNLRSPLLKSFRIMNISYKQLNSLNETNELWIQMFKKSGKVSIKQVVNFVRKNVEKKWLFYGYDSTLTFTSGLSHLVGANTENASMYLKTMYKNVYTDYAPVFSLRSRTFLTKLYFCENVRLEPNEFNVTSDFTVFDKITNRFLYGAEYSLVKPEGQNTTCIICIDGSGFQANAGNRSVVNPICMIMLHLVVWVLVRLMKKHG